VNSKPTESTYYGFSNARRGQRGIRMKSIAEQIRSEVSSWEGVSAEPHRFGGIEFRVNHRELGHLHGSRQADLPFSVRVREKLVAEGRASPHHILPETGWVTYYIRGEQDVQGAIDLFRLNYELITNPAKSNRME
jgi:Luciferase